MIRHRLEPWTLNARKRLVALLIERDGRLRGAFEIKASKGIAGADLSGLRAFHADHPKVPLAVTYDAAEPHELDGVRVLPWRLYFREPAEILG